MCVCVCVCVTDNKQLINMFKDDDKSKIKRGWKSWGKGCSLKWGGQGGLTQVTDGHRLAGGEGVILADW